VPSPETWYSPRNAALQRAALWNPYFYRFFGSEHGQVPLGRRPLSGDESCRALLQVVESLGGTHPRPRLLRRCLGQMWSSGYRPQDRVGEDIFQRLANVAMPHRHGPKEALKSLIHSHGYTPSSGAALEGLVAANSSAPGGGPATELTPTQLSFDGTAWTVKKQWLIQKPIRTVNELLDPLNWQRLSQIFKETRRIETTSKADDPNGSWQGVLEEKVTLNWNIAALQTFHTFLKIDFTVTPDVTRADYSLEYEAQNQIVIDDGYGEARRVSADRTQYTGVKRLRYASSFLNFMTPAVIAMALEYEHDESHE
jgi:hypothetical protein